MTSTVLRRQWAMTPETASILLNADVIAVDQETGRVVIASATCVDRDDLFLMGVQAVVVPGKGVAACQAAVDGTHKNQMLVYEELKKGTPPPQILEMLKKDPDIERRQFGMGRPRLGAQDIDG